jgi:UDP-glucuronate decarboxylase
MLELANLVIEITNSKSVLQNFDLPGDDPRQRKPDISTARALLDWEPKIQLVEGIKRTVDYFKGAILN